MRGFLIRKISGFVKVTSRSSPTKVRSQIFYVRTSQRFERPNRGFQLPPCPGVLSASALRAGALALAPTCTGLRGRPRPAPSPGPAPLLGRRQGCLWPRFMLNQAGKPNAAERRKSSRSGSRLDEIGQARRRLYWRALRCSKQLKRPPQTARRPAEEQAERGAARTPALFSSANARTTARLLRGSSFLPSFLCFVFTYFPLYAASRVGKGSSFLLLPSLLPLFAALAFIRTLRLSTQFI